MQKRANSDQYDSDGESNSKKPCNEKTTIRFLVKTADAGGIIGKGGSVIKRLRETYNAAVTVPDSESDERVLTIDGERSNCVSVLKEVLEITKEPPYSQFRDPNHGNAHEVNLMVQASQAGGMIGPKGARINDVREKSGAFVKLFPDRLSNSSERIVAIGGDSEAVTTCLEMVLGLLDQAPMQGNPRLYDPSVSSGMDEFQGGQGGGQGGGHDRPARGGMGMGRGMGRAAMRGHAMRGGMRGGPRGGGQFGGGYFQPPMHQPWGGYGGPGYGPGAGGPPFRPQGPPMGMGGPPGGAPFDQKPFGGPPGGPYGGNPQAGSGFGGNQSSSTQPPSSGPAPGLMDSATPSVPSSIQTVQVTITEDMVGAIIGHGGERINNTRHMSGADVKVGDKASSGKDRLVSISGSQHQCEHAQYLMQQSVQTFSK